MDNHNKGYNYELQIKDYIIKELNKMAYLWSHTPEDLLIQHNIIGSHNQARIKRKEYKDNPLIDTGIDIIQIDDDNNISLVQCKNGYKKGIATPDEKHRNRIYYFDNAGFEWELVEYSLPSFLL